MTPCVYIHVERFTSTCTCECILRHSSLLFINRTWEHDTMKYKIHAMDYSYTRGKVEKAQIPNPISPLFARKIMKKYYLGKGYLQTVIYFDSRSTCYRVWLDMWRCRARFMPSWPTPREQQRTRREQTPGWTRLHNTLSPPRV